MFGDLSGSNTFMNGYTIMIVNFQRSVEFSSQAVSCQENSGLNITPNFLGQKHSVRFASHVAIIYTW